MKIVVSTHQISDDDFGPDLFGRKKFGIALANIVKNSKAPLVISLDGNWGEGKSTFVKHGKKFWMKKKRPTFTLTLSLPIM